MRKKKHPTTTEEERDEILELYFAGENCKSIADKFDINPKTIHYILEYRGLGLRDKYLNRKYDLDESYFDSINSHEKAQILGFVFADGYAGRLRLTVKLAEKDRDYLEFIKNALKFSGEITSEMSSSDFIMGYPVKRTRAVRLEMYSEKLANSLHRIGCVKKKSLVKEFPLAIPDEYLNSFILGYFEGNGYISKIKKRKFGYTIGIVSGSYDFLFKLKEKVENKLGIKTYLRKARGHSYQFNIGKTNSIKKFLDWIYKDAFYTMARKRIIYDEFKAGFKPRILKKVQQIDPVTNEVIKTWNTRYELETKFPLCLETLEYRILKNKQYKGYKWSYLEHE